MKQISGKTKIMIAIALVIIVIGIVMVCTKGMNQELNYSEHTVLTIALNNLEKDKVVDIAKEVFENEIVFQNIGEFEDQLAINIKDLSEEKKNEFQEKLKELNAGEEVTVEQKEVGKIDIKDIVMPYIVPMIIVTVLYAIFNGIKNRKKGFVLNLILPIIVAVIIEGVYFSIYAIFGLPVGVVSMPVAAALLVLTLTAYSLKKGEAPTE